MKTSDSSLISDPGVVANWAMSFRQDSHNGTKTPRGCRTAGKANSPCSDLKRITFAASFLGPCLNHFALLCLRVNQCCFAAPPIQRPHPLIGEWGSLRQVAFRSRERRSFAGAKGDILQPLEHLPGAFPTAVFAGDRRGAGVQILQQRPQMLFGRVDITVFFAQSRQPIQPSGCLQRRMCCSRCSRAASGSPCSSRALP